MAERIGSNNASRSPFKCLLCRDESPGKRYHHFLKFQSQTELEDHLNDEGFNDGTRAGILDWYRTTIANYAQEAKDTKQSIDRTWRLAMEEARHAHYAVRDQPHAEQIVREFYDDMADLGLNEQEAVEFANQKVYGFLNRGAAKFNN